MFSKEKIIFVFSVSVLFLFGCSLVVSALTLSEKLKGRIVLEVERNGEAWYIDPVEQERYFLGDPDRAFSLMREKGLGISDADLYKIPLDLNYLSTLKDIDTDSDNIPDKYEELLGTDATKADSDRDSVSDHEELVKGRNPLGEGNIYDSALIKRLSGKILLQVEKNGEAWYIDPNVYKRYYLGRPADALKIMRYRGLGISYRDISQIKIAVNQEISYDRQDEDQSSDSNISNSIKVIGPEDFDGIKCGADLNCLLSASKKCDSAIGYSNISTDYYGAIFTSYMYYQINKNNFDECELFQKVEDKNVDFSIDYTESMKDFSSELNSNHTSLNSSLKSQIGQSGICTFREENGIVDFFSILLDHSLKQTRKCFTDQSLNQNCDVDLQWPEANCSGPLFFDGIN